MKNFDVFLIFLSVRILSVFLIQTYFVPDEYWQSLEVAHKIIFNYGYLTWEWIAGIRSYVYPLLIAVFYKTVAIFGLDSAEILIFGPRILQATLTAYADLSFYKWSGTKKWAVFSIATSWFLFYTGSRTLINSLEYSLTTIALSHFPWPDKTEIGTRPNVIFISLVAFLCAVRPTAAVYWLPLCVYHLIVNRNDLIQLILKRYIPIGLMILTSSIILDSLAHGSFVITPYEFLKFNVIQDVGSFYGQHPWYWYLSSGLPAVLGIQFLPFVLATIVILKHRDIHQNELALLGTIVFTVFIFSLLPHKEFRFLLPILPIVLYISSRFLSAWSRKANNLMLWSVASIIFLGNLVPAWYLGMVHQSGILPAMTELRGIANGNPKETNLLFLMPCHSTPLYSHLHVNVTTKFLTCEPNFNSSRLGYVDEADAFYNNPTWWMRQHYPPNGTLPSHIICFDSLVPSISDVLSTYKLVRNIFHTSLPTGRIGRFVQIHELIKV